MAGWDRNLEKCRVAGTCRTKDITLKTGYNYPVVF
jgi:hypothetical protein